MKKLLYSCDGKPHGCCWLSSIFKSWGHYKLSLYVKDLLQKKHLQVNCSFNICGQKPEITTNTECTLEYLEKKMNVGTNQKHTCYGFKYMKQSRRWERAISLSPRIINWLKSKPQPINELFVTQSKVHANYPNSPFSNHSRVADQELCSLVWFGKDCVYLGLEKGS